MSHHFYSHSHDLKRICIQYLHHYVKVKTVDDHLYEGVIEHVDDDYMYLLMPLDREHMIGQDQGRGVEGERQFFPGVYPGYGYGYPYPFYPGYRRFILPLAALTALSLLPYSFYW